MPFNQETRECFGEDVGCHLSSGDISWGDLLSPYDLTNPMVVDVDMFHSAVMFGILDDSDGRLVVHQYW